MTPVDSAPSSDDPAPVDPTTGRPDDPAAPTTPRPAAVGPARRRSRRVVRPGTEQAGVAGLGSDDDAASWGDVRPGASTESHDAELLRDVPPHWS
ncbi:hypothetical protein EQW78_03205 [Oerskovia turbata]|uniref:Uncharacterized protein n=1 Tax=Oerskovia turbata TaxID=1713 RepID=A0A4Q1L0W3_9CELL|nr:hypothetical protein [Oerskovia turbata]RXR26878.1 hypothetical protein EQW73_05220 [Oerskovia turbata]RXR36280.1 hypothetical protein EQW78_03205 [Oerskovia turbata]